MKPSFALNFTEEGVTLLHRTARGWLDVGHAAFSDPDLPAALDYLRSSALGLAPKGITSKLVIPNSQILYTSVDAPGPSDEAKREQIEAALVGRTPYSVDELIYDWSGDGPTVRVAVVAKETLAEAEAFANEHKFNPVSFVAIPDSDFAGEPFFGTSSVSSNFLKKNEKVEKEPASITIIAREIPKVEDDLQRLATATSVPEPETTATETAPDLPEASLPPVERETVEETPVPEIAIETTNVAEVEPSAPRPTFDEQQAPASMVEEPAKFSEIEAAEAPMAIDVPVDDDEVSPRLGSPAAASSIADPAIVETDVDDIPAAPSSAALAAFASRRSGEVPMPPPRSAGSAIPSTSATSSTVTAPAVPAPTVPRPSGAKPPPEKPISAKPPKFSYDDPVPPPPRLPGDPPLSTAPAAKAAKSLKNLVTAPSIPGTRSKKPAPIAAARLAKPAVNPADTAATDLRPDQIAKGLGSRANTVKGKPRFLGLILTGVLLLVLALVAAWSSVYLGSNDPLDQPLPNEDVALIAPPAELAVEPGQATASADPAVVASAEDGPVGDQEVPAPDDEMLADMQDPAEFSESPETDLATDETLSAEPTAQDLAIAEALDEATLSTSTQALVVEPAPAEEASVSAAPEPVAEPIAEEVAAAPPPETGLEATVGSSVSSGTEAQDEIFLAGMDALPAISDPLTLTQPAATGDAPPDPAMPPPPFGTVYRFDENGRIVPTEEGITTPEGVLLIAGKPSILPPQRPQAVEAAFVAAAPASLEQAPTNPPIAESTQPAGAVLPAETFAADPALQSARPRVRPADLAPAAPAAGEDDASLAPAEDSRFASLRPRLRPESILARNEELNRASDAASLAVQAAAAAAAADVAVAQAAALSSASQLAVAVSRVPAPRPRNMNNAVQAAVAAATQPDRTPRAAEPETSNEEEEEADSEPEVASAAPRIPTRANVAKQATYVNAINLSKTNLIGVYGTQSKRYALVRQSNGRYKKVKVGDNLEGGKVQAITANEVRYQKGGKLITLGMPRS